MYIFSWNAQTANITHVDKSEFTRACLSSLCRDRTHSFWTRKGWLDVWQIVPCAPGPPDTHMTYIVCVFSALERQGVCWGEAYCAHTHSPTVGGRKGAVTGLTAAGLFSFPWSSAVRLIVSAACFCVCVWTLSAAFPGPWPIRTVIHDKGNCGQPPQCFAPQLPGNRRFPSPLLS